MKKRFRLLKEFPWITNVGLNNSEFIFNLLFSLGRIASGEMEYLQPHVNYFVNPYFIAQVKMENYWNERAIKEVSIHPLVTV